MKIQVNLNLDILSFPSLFFMTMRVARIRKFDTDFKALFFLFHQSIQHLQFAFGNFVSLSSKMAQYHVSFFVRLAHPFLASISRQQNTFASRRFRGHRDSLPSSNDSVPSPFVHCFLYSFEWSGSFYTALVP